MSRQNDLKKLIAEHQRHLQILKEQAAGFGSLNVPTHIVTQIQDREAEIEQLQVQLAALESNGEDPPSPVVSSPAAWPAKPNTHLAALRAKPRIFLCHASEDKPQVADLYRQLQAAGYHPWLDKFDLLPGQDWWTEIEKIIRDPYNLVLVCLSHKSTTKRGLVQKEIKRALNVLDEMPEDTIYLIPARLEDCQVPDRLSHLHWVNLFEPDGVEKLKRALDFELNKRHPNRQPFEPELIYIPAGEFLMGSDPDIDEDAEDDEQPQHTLYLPDYYIAKTPVTNAQYAVYVQMAMRRQPKHWNKEQPPVGKQDHPVVRVSWHDAQGYCHWLTKTTGRTYRLPTEAEWEKAARGPDGRIYPWGNEWEAKRCNTRFGDTTTVGAYPDGASPYGVLDMAGNVVEWTLSLWGRSYGLPDFRYPYNRVDGRENLRADNNFYRVIRGGPRCAYRYRYAPQFNTLRKCGFRIVVSPSSLTSAR